MVGTSGHGERLLCVGGTLHGRVIEVSEQASAVYVDHGTGLEVVPPPGWVDDSVTLRVSSRLEVYTRRRLHGLLLLVLTNVAGSSVEREGVDALRIAAGLGGGG